MSRALSTLCRARSARPAHWIALAVVGAALCAAAPARAAVSFAPVATVNPGAAPHAAVAADFDSDGIQDLVTANATDNSIAVLLGTGGGFRAPIRYATGSRPFALAAGDLDGDGRQDLVTANLYSDSLSVFLSTGSGTFAAPASLATGAGPFSVAVADLNSDGRQDIVSANSGANTVSIFFGTGGGFGAPTSLATGAGPASVAVADLDGDGRRDIVTANEAAGTVSVILGIGGGFFAPAASVPVGDGPYSVGVADVDGDGKRDVVTANRASDDVSVLYGAGDGSFSLPTNLPVQALPTSVVVTDLDADGRQDLVVVNSRSDSVSILLGRGGRTFAPQATFAVGDGARSAVVADFDADGRPDVATTNVDAQDVSLLFATGPGALALSASDLAFPAQVSGTLSPAQAITVRNSGARTVRVTSVAVTGTNADDFIVTGDGCGGTALLVGGTCSIRIRFAPSSPGRIAGTLRISSDVPGDAYDVALSGVGIDAPSDETVPAGPGSPKTLGGTPRAGRLLAVGPVRVVCTTPARARGRGMVCRVALTVSRRAIRLDGRLSRGAMVYARGARAVRAGRAQLDMPAIRRMTAGRYTLRVVVTDRSGARTVVQTQIVLAR